MDVLETPHSRGARGTSEHCTQQAPLNTEEEWLYSKLLQDDRTRSSNKIHFKDVKNNTTRLLQCHHFKHIFPMLSHENWLFMLEFPDFWRNFQSASLSSYDKRWCNKKKSENVQSSYSVLIWFHFFTGARWIFTTVKPLFLHIISH